MARRSVQGTLESAQNSDEIDRLESELAALTERGKSEDQLEDIRIKLRSLRGEPEAEKVRE